MGFQRQPLARAQPAPSHNDVSGRRPPVSSARKRRARGIIIFGVEDYDSLLRAGVRASSSAWPHPAATSSLPTQPPAAAALGGAPHILLERYTPCDECAESYV